MMAVEELAKILPAPERRRQLTRNNGVPYYLPLRAATSLGYRRNRSGGVWVLRCSVSPGKQRVATIGQADDLFPANARDILNFKQATTRVEELIYFKANWDDEVLPRIRLYTAREQLIQMLAEQRSSPEHPIPMPWPGGEEVKPADAEVPLGKPLSPKSARSGLVALLQLHLPSQVHADLYRISKALDHDSIEETAETAITEWVDNLKDRIRILPPVIRLALKP